MKTKLLVKTFGSSGLDSLHIALIAAIIILIALLFLIGVSRPVIIRNITNYSSNCTYLINGSCIKPLYNNSFILGYAERILASYAYINSVQSIIPFIANISQASVSFIPSINKYLVNIPLDINNKTALFSILINDSKNLSYTSLEETIRPAQISNDKLVYKGVIYLANSAPCNTSNNITQYWFMDPYQPGAYNELNLFLNIRKNYSYVNSKLFIIFGNYSQQVASEYGFENASYLGSYLFCASQQKNFPEFVKILENYQGYIPKFLLSNIASEANLNFSVLNACLANASSHISAQTLLASHFNVSSSASVVTNCQYLSLPNTAIDAINYLRR